MRLLIALPESCASFTEAFAQVQRCGCLSAAFPLYRCTSSDQPIITGTVSSAYLMMQRVQNPMQSFVLHAPT